MIKWLNKYCESCGPGLASGWYWTLNAEKLLHSIPSTVWSFKLICVTDIFSGKFSKLTENPWFWLVISIFSVVRFLTGWLHPRWPNFNLYVSAPRAKHSIWWPRHIPKIGILHFNNSWTVLIP